MIDWQSSVVYFGIGLLVTMFIKRGVAFPGGTKSYEKVLGLGFMMMLWPTILCVISPDQNEMSAGQRPDRAVDRG